MTRYNRANLEECGQFIRDFQPFTSSTGNLRGMRMNFVGPIPMGHLPVEALLYTSVQSARYVVTSYGTPIGWVDAAGMLVVPEYRYSITTTDHQWALIYAWKLQETKRPFEWPLIAASTGSRRGGW